MQHLGQHLLKNKFHNKENKFCLLDTDNQNGKRKNLPFFLYRPSVA